jgi:hypothetical protein
MTRPDDPNWPAIPYSSWSGTLGALHMWTQIVGKVRLMCAPVVNHWWDSVLYVSARGLTTSPIGHPGGVFDMEFDFLDEALSIRKVDGGAATVALESGSVAGFYGRVMETLASLGVEVVIRPLPNEVQEAIPFDRNTTPVDYDAEAARRFWLALVQADRVFKEFRARFLGKSSPVHFFWGAPDLAVTRFSGRRAPEHPGGFPHLPDWVTREAYSHEVSSAGFWPGSPDMDAAFYSYAYPNPAGFSDAAVEPEAAFWSEEMGEFFLPYEAVRTAPDPDAALMRFLQSTYEAAADLAAWDRASLERPARELRRLEAAVAIR